MQFVWKVSCEGGEGGRVGGAPGAGLADFPALGVQITILSYFLLLLHLLYKAIVNATLNYYSLFFAPFRIICAI